MAELASPFEILELADEGKLTTKVNDWREGEFEIKPRDGRPPKTIKAIRLFVPKETKAHFPFYWDLTSASLVAQLSPLLPSIVGSDKTLTITKHGVAPKARFTVEVA